VLSTSDSPSGEAPPATETLSPPKRRPNEGIPALLRAHPNLSNLTPQALRLYAYGYGYIDFPLNLFELRSGLVAMEPGKGS
jgi:hypothetical protein